MHMRNRIPALAALTLLLASPAQALAESEPAAETPSAHAAAACGAFTTTNPAGQPVRPRRIRTKATGCAQARRVIRDFYSQLLGSSGATIALGFQCGYYAYGERV